MPENTHLKSQPPANAAALQVEDGRTYQTSEGFGVLPAAPNLCNLIPTVEECVSWCVCAGRLLRAQEDITLMKLQNSSEGVLVNPYIYITAI